MKKENTLFKNMFLMPTWSQIFKNMHENRQDFGRREKLDLVRFWEIRFDRMFFVWETKLTQNQFVSYIY